MNGNGRQIVTPEQLAGPPIPGVKFISTPMATPAAITVQDGQYVISSVFGGMTKLEQGALMIAAGAAGVTFEEIAQHAGLTPEERTAVIRSRITALTAFSSALAAAVLADCDRVAAEANKPAMQP